jgi:hypothetical protein
MAGKDKQRRKTAEAQEKSSREVTKAGSDAIKGITSLKQSQINAGITKDMAEVTKLKIAADQETTKTIAIYAAIGVGILGLVFLAIFWIKKSKKV